MVTLQDLRYALRAFATHRGFVAAAVISLAVGIGANTAIFSVTSALLLHPLPYANADRLVILWNRSPGLNITEDWFSTAQYNDIKTGHQGFEQVAIAIGANENLTGDGEPERIGTIRVSANLLSMLGARAAFGRLFVGAEDAPGQPGVAVLSDGTWTRRYGRDPDITLRSITLNGRPYRIVGVLPSAFSLPREVLPTLGVVEDGEVFLPLPLGPAAAADRGHEDYNIIGLLKPGVSPLAAQTEMDALTSRLRRDHPDVYPPNGGLTFSIVPLQDQVVGGVRRTLIVLAAAVAFVLLIACANVANLLLARALGRRKEIAVRAALGASRARIVRQLLTESLVLAFSGGALGILLAMLAVRWIHALQPVNVPRLQDIAINGDVLTFTILLCAAAGMAFGLAPALGAGRIDVHATLKDAGRGSSGAQALWGRGNHLRRGLVVVELALSVTLLIGAGLLIRSFARVRDVAPGFAADHILTFELTMNGRKYGDGATVLNAYHHLWERLDALPGVVASGGVTALPLSDFFAWGPITVEGRTPPTGEQFINADQRTAGGRYFETMKIPLLRGRWFTPDDTAKNARVVIIDDEMARELWPNADPIGKRIKYGDAASTSPWETVVGVVGRVKQYALDADARMAFYRPQTQSPSRAMFVVVRSRDDPSAIAAGVGGAIREVDSDLPVYHLRPMTARVDASLARRRFSMVLLGLFAGLALVLAAIGTYGVMAYLVDQGTRDVGIRIALGATQRAILGLILRQGLVVALAGVALGLTGAFLLTRLMQSLLFGVGPADPLTFGLIAMLLLTTALAASFFPARRAARTDPIVSLRNE